MSLSRSKPLSHDRGLRRTTNCLKIIRGETEETVTGIYNYYYLRTNIWGGYEEETRELATLRGDPRHARAEEIPQSHFPPFKKRELYCAYPCSQSTKRPTGRNEKNTSSANDSSIQRSLASIHTFFPAQFFICWL